MPLIGDCLGIEPPMTCWIQVYEFLGPKVNKSYLHWAIWIPRVGLRCCMRKLVSNAAAALQQVHDIGAKVTESPTRDARRAHCLLSHAALTFSVTCHVFPCNIQRWLLHVCICG